MKILLFGQRGMAGHMIFKYLKEKGHDVVTPDTLLGHRFNAVKDLEELGNKLDAEEFSYIINSIGLLVKNCEENKIQAIKINSLFPHKLAKICEDIDINMIHLSTDCYLDESIYGRSKRAGEIYYGNNLTIRTSIIGPELKTDGTGLFSWFMEQEGEVKGYSNVIWDGITTLELAKFIHWYLLKENKKLGIRNLRHPNPISKYNILLLINKIYKKNIKINKFNDIIEDKTEKNDFHDYKIPSYREMIEELKEFNLRNIK